MASLTDDNEAGGNLDKRNIWLIGVGHTSLKFCFSFIFQIPFQASYNVFKDSALRSHDFLDEPNRTQDIY